MRHPSVGAMRLSRARRGVVLALAAGAVALVALPGAATGGGAPSNDSVHVPRHITSLPYEYLETTASATFVGEPTPTCSTGHARTIWYRFSPTRATHLVASTAGSLFDTFLQAYRATANGLVPVACNDDWQAITSRVRFDAAGGNVYYFQIGGWQGAGGEARFNLWEKPINDSFSKATRVTSLASTFELDTTSATGQVGEPAGCFAVGRTVWFRYAPTRSRTIQVDTFGSHWTYDTKINVYRGTSLSSLSQVTCNDNGGPDLHSRVTFDASAGSVYYVQITGDPGEFGYGPLTVTFSR